MQGYNASNTRSIRIDKATPGDNERILDVAIHINGGTPDFAYVNASTKLAYYQRQAEALAEALISSLPSSTRDWLLVELLRTKIEEIQKSQEEEENA